MNKSISRFGCIETLSIRGFRSLADVEQLKLSNLSVLIGSNGAGKSNFIRFFDMLSWIIGARDLQTFVLREGGGDDQLFLGAKHTPTLSAELSIRTPRGVNDYAFELSYNHGQDNLFFSREAFRFSSDERKGKNRWTELPMPTRESELALAKRKNGNQNKTATTIIRLLQRCQTYQFHDTSSSAYIKQPWDVADTTWLRRDGGNLASILLHLQENEPKRYQLITRQIKRVLPSFENFVLQKSYEKVSLRWRGTQSDKTFGAHLTSDGSLRLFCLLTLINLPDEMLPDMLLFDEPELGLHPQAIQLVSSGLQRLASKRQVFIATQSTYMVDCFNIDNIIVANSQQGRTSLKNLDINDYQQWINDEYKLSELWLSDVMGGGTC